MGGWQADLTGVGPTFGLPSSGVILSSTGGTATLTNDGSIGALSDRAVAGDPLVTDNTQIINNGTIIGFVQFTGHQHYHQQWHVQSASLCRHQRRWDRDTLRVAISDLGSGPQHLHQQRNAGFAGQSRRDHARQHRAISAAGTTFNAMALGGPVQGQILGATTFINSGIIDLQANPVAGDVLLITGARQTPGAHGGGTFISNGGRLRSIPCSTKEAPPRAPTSLFVDGTSVGPAGPTQHLRAECRRRGALTVGNGILAVEAPTPAVGSRRFRARRAGHRRPLRIHAVPGRRWNRCSQRKLVPALDPELRALPDFAAVPDANPADTHPPPTAATALRPELPRRNLALCGDPVDGAALRPQSARHAA